MEKKMYIEKVEIENFRIFGEKVEIKKPEELEIKINKKIPIWKKVTRHRFSWKQPWVTLQ